MVARIAGGGGPGGIALDEDGAPLYVLNRFDESISIVDTLVKAEVGVVPLRYNPEPEVVQAGRPVLYNARRSGHGDLACASCHVFADFDSLAWDLGNPNGAVEPNPLRNRDDEPLLSFHPMRNGSARHGGRELRPGAVPGEPVSPTMNAPLHGRPVPDRVKPAAPGGSRRNHSSTSRRRR